MKTVRTASDEKSVFHDSKISKTQEKVKTLEGVVLSVGFRVNLEKIQIQSVIFSFKEMITRVFSMDYTTDKIVQRKS